MPLNFPTSASINQTYQSGSSSVYRWNGSYWQISAPALTNIVIATASYSERVAWIQETPPPTSTGSMWYDVDTGNTYIKYDSAWVPVQSNTVNATSASFATTARSASFAQSASLATRTRHTHPTGWQLYSVDTNMYNIGSQNLWATSPNFTFLSGSNVTFTVPAGFAQTKVIFDYWNWGDAGSNNPAVGSLRYSMSSSILGGNVSGLGMASWSQPIAGGTTVRWNAKSVTEVFNATPGTYTVRLGVGREQELGGGTGLVSWNVQGRVEVYVQQ